LFGDGDEEEGGDEESPPDDEGGDDDCGFGLGFAFGNAASLDGLTCEEDAGSVVAALIPLCCTGKGERPESTK